MSDTHFEFMNRSEGEEFLETLTDLQNKDPAEVCVIAGDFCQIGQHQRFWKARMAEICSLYKKVVYTEGNHEFWGTSFKEAEEFVDRAKLSPELSNFHVLRDGPVEYGGIRFIGDTMWYAVDEDDNMIDFWKIQDSHPGIKDRNQRFVDTVLNDLRAGDVVVTHHLPFEESVDARYKGDLFNKFFLFDIENLIPSIPKGITFIHGHTHLPMNYQKILGSRTARVYCNPLAYKNEGTNCNFWNRVAIDVEPAT